ncbi:MAG: serine/threonine protein kinase [Rectinema sp.]|nr:serine/threonine protein kinase [Rectinema sp.]
MPLVPTKSSPKVPGLPQGYELRDIDGKRIVVNRVIGKGGLGIVYSGTMQEYGSCAIKVPRKLAYGTDILNETRWLYRIQHAGVVPVISFGVWQCQDLDNLGVPFLVMPLYAQSASDLLEQKPQGLPLEVIMSWVIDIARGLRRMRLVHRDIKPENIYIMETGQAVLGDFGLAIPGTRAEREKSGCHVGSRPCGTPDYMSPEQFVVSPDIDQRSDIYALGLLIYELATGKAYRTPASRQRLTLLFTTLMENEERQRDPAFTVRLADQVLEGPIATLIERACRAKPQERYQNYSDFLADALRFIKRPLRPDLLQRAVCLLQ